MYIANNSTIKQRCDCHCSFLSLMSDFFICFLNMFFSLVVDLAKNGAISIVLFKKSRYNQLKLSVKSEYNYFHLGNEIKTLNNGKK